MEPIRSKRVILLVTATAIASVAAQVAAVYAVLHEPAEPDVEAPVPGTGGWLVEMTSPVCDGNVYVLEDGVVAPSQRIDCSASNESTCTDATTLAATTGTCVRNGAGSPCAITTVSRDCTVARCEGGVTTICTVCADGACVGCSTTRCTTGACLDDASGCAPGG